MPQSPTPLARKRSIFKVNRMPGQEPSDSFAPEHFFSPYKGTARTVAVHESVDTLIRTPEFFEWMTSKGLTMSDVQNEQRYLDSLKLVRQRIPDLSTRLIDAPPPSSALEPRIGDMSNVPTAKWWATCDFLVTISTTVVLTCLWLAGLLELHPTPVAAFDLIWKVFAAWMLLGRLFDQTLFASLYGLTYVSSKNGHRATPGDVRKFVLLESAFAVFTLGLGSVCSLGSLMLRGQSWGMYAQDLRVVKLNFKMQQQRKESDQAAPKPRRNLNRAPKLNIMAGGATPTKGLQPTPQKGIAA